MEKRAFDCKQTAVSSKKLPFGPDSLSPRQAKLDLRTATGKVEEMTRLLQNVQEQMQRKVGDCTRLPHPLHPHPHLHRPQLRAAQPGLEAGQRACPGTWRSGLPVMLDSSVFCVFNSSVNLKM